MKAKKKKKTILISVLIGGIVVGAAGLAVIFFTFRSPTSPSPVSEKPSRRKPPPENPQNPPVPRQPTPTPNGNCPYLTESNLTTPLDKPGGRYIKMTLDEEDIAKWRQIPASFVVNGWNKGYHWHDILQLWEWKIPETEIPNLKAEKRVGVINSLHVFLDGVLPPSIFYDDSIPKEEKKRMANDDSVSGMVKNLVVIIRNKPFDEPSIKIDGKIPCDNQRYYCKLINLFRQQEKVNLSQHQICLLECIGVEYLGKEGDIKFGVSIGESTGSAVYLSLLSAWHKKSLSRQVSATGWVITKKKKIKLNNSEIEVATGTNLPIGGIKGKTIGASKKGINCLVFSKFQTAPHRVLVWSKKQQRWTGEGYEKEDDYQLAVPVEIKNKIKQVHWTENINQLRDLVLESKLS